MGYGTTSAGVLFAATLIGCGMIYLRLPTTVPHVDEEAERRAAEARLHGWMRVRPFTLLLAIATVTPASYLALLAVRDRDLAAIAASTHAELALGAWRWAFLFPAMMIASIACAVLISAIDRLVLGRERQARINFADRYRGGKDGVRFALPFAIMCAIIMCAVSFLLFDTYFVMTPDEVVFNPLFGVREVRRPYRAVLNVYDVELTAGGRDGYMERPHWLITFRDGAVWNNDDSLHGLHLHGQHAQDAAMVHRVAERAGVAVTRVRRFP